MTAKICLYNFYCDNQLLCSILYISITLHVKYFFPDIGDKKFEYSARKEIRARRVFFSFQICMETYQLIVQTPNVYVIPV